MNRLHKEVFIKTALIMLISGLLISMFILGTSLTAERKLSLTTTYIAVRDIEPRRKIKAEDLLEIEVPAAYLMDNVYNDMTQIVGKYTDIQGKIPAGSLFYKTMLKNENELPDYPATQLREGQSAYTLETDISRLGGSLAAGQRVDIYVTINERDGTTITGALFEYARVISVKDHKGIDVTSDDSTHTPFMAILAVNQSDIDYLAAADELGSIRLIASSHTYEVTKEAVLQSDTAVFSYIKSALG